MANAAAAPEKMTLDRSDGSATIELYRAVLGPVQVDYYLKAFTRFDAAGKSGPSWNWAAGLLTLNWMAFHRLWGAALVYAGVLTATLLLLFGILPLIVALPQPGLWALLALAILLAVAVPGVYGNAWLYAACNKAMERAYSNSATQEEACTLLQTRAAGRQRLGGLAAGNLALLAAVAATMMAWPGSGTLPLNSSRMEQARAQPAPSMVPLATVTAAAAETASSRTSQGRVQAVPASAPASTPSTSSASAPAAAASAPVAVAEAVAEAKVPTAKASAPVKAPPAAPVSRIAPARSATASAPASPADPASATGTEKFLINVGLFADANNARNATKRLMDADLPATSQEFSTSKGLRTRVRVGPFETRAEADAAAEKIRALKLEAAVFRN